MNTPNSIVEQVIAARMKAHGKLIIHCVYDDGSRHDWSGYPKDRRQLDNWIAGARTKGWGWTLC